MVLVRILTGSALSQRPGRALFSILGISIGIATVVGVFVLDHNTVVGLSMRGANEWRPALEVRPSAGVADPADELAHTPGVASYSSFFQNDVVARAAGETGSREDSARRVRLFALDAPSVTKLDAVRIESGRTLDPERKQREVLVGGALAEALRLQVGDALLLSRPPRTPSSECVDGEIRAVDDGGAREAPPAVESFQVVGILAREKLGRRSQGEVVVADAGWARELFQGAYVDAVWWVSHDPDVDLEKLRASLGTSFSYSLNKHVIIGAAADERAFRNGVRMAGLFALVLGLYVIFHTLSMGIVERVREVATLHALGATRKQIARVFFAEAVVLALTAAVLGLAGGLGLARYLLLAGVTTLGTGHRITVFEIPWGSVLGLVGIGVGVALLGSVYPLLRVRGSSTSAALRGDEASRASGVARGFHLFAALLLAALLPALYFTIVPVVGEKQKELVGAVLAAVGFLAVLVTLPLVVPALLGALASAIARPLRALFTFSGRISSFAMRASPARIAFSSAAIALVAAAVVGLKSMTASLEGEIDAWAGRAIASKVYVRGLPNATHADVRRAFDTLPNTLVSIENGGARTYVPFLLLGMKDDELARRGPLAENAALRERFARGDALIVSERLARHLKYAVGDRVHVGNASGKVQDLEVVAVSDAYGYFPHPDERLYGVASDRFLAKAFCMNVDALQECALVLAPDADPYVARAALETAFPGAKIQVETGKWLREEHLADLGRDFRLFDLILALSALLAALGVLNGQLLSTLERAKELGVLKALGATKRQIAGSIACEALVVGAFGGVLGTLIGAALAPVIVRALEALSGLDLPLTGAGTWLWAVPLGCVALALVAAFYPMLRVTRNDAVAAVRAP